MFENLRDFSILFVVCLPHAAHIMRSGASEMPIGGVCGCSGAFAVSMSFRTAEIYHRDIRIEDRRGRNLRYRAREKEVAIRAPVISLAH